MFRCIWLIGCKWAQFNLTKWPNRLHNIVTWMNAYENGFWRCKKFSWLSHTARKKNQGKSVFHFAENNMSFVECHARTHKYAQQLLDWNLICWLIHAVVAYANIHTHRQLTNQSTHQPTNRNRTSRAHIYFVRSMDIVVCAVACLFENVTSMMAKWPMLIGNIKLTFFLLYRITFTWKFNNSTRGTLYQLVIIFFIVIISPEYSRYIENIFFCF